MKANNVGNKDILADGGCQLNKHLGLIDPIRREQVARAPHSDERSRVPADYVSKTTQRVFREAWRMLRVARMQACIDINADQSILH